MGAPCLDLEPDECEDYECHREPRSVDYEKVLVEGETVWGLMLDNNSGYRATFRYSAADHTDLSAHVSGPRIPTPLVDERLTGTLGGWSPEALDRL